MFDTSRLLSYLSKPIELPNSLWSDIDFVSNERQSQLSEDSNSIEDTLASQASGPTTPTPNCTKLQLFTTMSEEIDTSLELFTNRDFVSSPTSFSNKDVQPSTISPTPSSRISSSNRIKLKTSCSNPHLRTPNQFNEQRSLYPATSSVSLTSPRDSVNRKGEDKLIANPFARNKKHSSGASFDESLYTRRQRTTQPMLDHSCFFKDGKEDYGVDLISDDSPISTPTISPSTSPLPQNRQYDERNRNVEKKKMINGVFCHYPPKVGNGSNIVKPNRTPKSAAAVKVMHSTSSSDSDWYSELMDGLDFGASDEWIGDCKTKSNYHQNVRFSSHTKDRSLKPPLPFDHTVRAKNAYSHTSKPGSANTKISAPFDSPLSFELTHAHADKNSKSEPRLRRVAGSIKNTLSPNTPRQPRRSDISPPRVKDGYQPTYGTSRYDSRNPHPPSTRMQNQSPSTKSTPTTISSATSPRTRTTETKPNLVPPRPFLRKNSATTSNKSRLPTQPTTASPKPDAHKQRHPDALNNKTTSPINNTDRRSPDSKLDLVQNIVPHQFKAHTRSNLDHPTNLKINTNSEAAGKQLNSKCSSNNKTVTKSCLSGLLSPTRPGLIPYPYKERKKSHIVGNMQFDPIKMCWNSVDGNGGESNEEDDPFAGFSSDEEDSVFPNIQGTSENPVEEFVVGTEFQLSARELREMFKTEIEHKSIMQRWYAKADRCTNHDRMGLKDPVVRRVELLDIRLTWPDQFATKSSQRP